MDFQFLLHAQVWITIASGLIISEKYFQPKLQNAKAFWSLDTKKHQPQPHFFGSMCFAIFGANVELYYAS